MTYDTAVIGAGPAGCAATIELARAGATVLLVEKETFPRHKVCGEFLSPEVAEVLGELGCNQILDDAIRIEEARVHTASGRVLTFPFEPLGFSLSRHALDNRLLGKAMEAGATFERRNVLDPAGLPAKVVIPAWGRKIRDNIGGGFFGFKAHFKGEWPSRVDLHFFPGGYVGVSPVEGGSINVCGLIEKRLVREAESIARGILGASPQQEWPFLFTGPLHPGWQGGKGLSAGDAAAFLDPFTGDGISLALRSGRLAARAALSGAASSEAQYRRQLHDMTRGQFIAARLLRFGVERRWLEAPAAALLESLPGLRRMLFGITRGKTVVK